jgi:hypothetical protein
MGETTEFSGLARDREAARGKRGAGLAAAGIAAGMAGAGTGGGRALGAGVMPFRIQTYNNGVRRYFRCLKKHVLNRKDAKGARRRKHGDIWFLAVLNGGEPEFPLLLFLPLCDFAVKTAA